MKRVLVTGATGFIGYQSLIALSGRGYEVIAVTSKPRPEPFPDVRMVSADLMNPFEAADLFATFRPDTLLHFAWYAEPGKYWTAPENFRWVEASLTLLREFAANGGKRIVTAGTCAEYDWTAGCCIEGRTALAPATVYGACKHALQQMQGAFCRQAGISEAWGRIFLTYGPRERPRRLVAAMINALLKREPALCTHGRQVRDLLHVQDVAEAFVALLESDAEGPVNIASGKPTTLADVAHTIADMLAGRDLIHLGALPAPPDEPPLLLADTTRLDQEVGWTPRFDLATGLEQTIHWWHTQHYRDGANSAALTGFMPGQVRGAIHTEGRAAAKGARIA